LGFAFVQFGLAFHEFALFPIAVFFAAGAVGGWEFGLRSDGTELGVEDDFVDRGGGDAVGVVHLFGEVEAGDLEAVEEQAGVPRVELFGGEALEDESDGGLDGGAVFGEGELERVVGLGLGATGATASGVVVVAEVFVAQADGSATVSVVEDVAALKAPGFFGFGHGLPLGIFWSKDIEINEIDLDWL
jgi:hypothetical protein